KRSQGGLMFPAFRQGKGAKLVQFTPSVLTRTFTAVSASNSNTPMVLFMVSNTEACPEQSMGGVVRRVRWFVEGAAVNPRSEFAQRKALEAAGARKVRSSGWLAEAGVTAAGSLAQPKPAGVCPEGVWSSTVVHPAGNPFVPEKSSV